MSDIVVTPRKCPGLVVARDGVRWQDSLGREHDLLRERRMSPGEAAIQMKRSTEWVLRLIREGQLFPVVSFNPRSIEVFQCAIDDYIARSIQFHNQPATGGDAA